MKSISGKTNIKHLIEGFLKDIGFVKILEDSNFTVF